MSDSKIEIEYKVVSISDSLLVKNLVEIFLEPTDKTVFERPEGTPQNPGMIFKSNDMGLPPEVQQIMMQIPMQMSNMMKQKNKEDDPRGIVILEDPIEFRTKGWMYGDTITVSFEKKEEK